MTYAIWLNEEQTVGNLISDDGGSAIVMEPGYPMWAEFVAMNPIPYVPPVLPDPILAIRAGMVVSKMQSILALGQMQWDQVLAYRETATWAERVVIDSAADWRRLSQNTAFFQYLLGLSDEETDDLFVAAAQIVA